MWGFKSPPRYQRVAAKVAALFLYSIHTPQEVRKLMVLLKSPGNQIDVVRVSEIPGLQIQSILRKPMSSRRRSAGFPGCGIGTRNL